MVVLPVEATLLDHKVPLTGRWLQDIGSDIRSTFLGKELLSLPSTCR